MKSEKKIAIEEIEKLLYMAADRDVPELMKKLLDNYLFSSDSLKKTLDRAIYYVEELNIKYLHQAGANIFEKHKVLKTAFDYGNEDLFKWTLEQYNIKKCQSALKIFFKNNDNEEIIELKEFLLIRLEFLLLKHQQENNKKNKKMLL